MPNRIVSIFGGGTVSHLRAHLALCAPAYGQTARRIQRIIESDERWACDIEMNLTRMANGASRLETNEDVAARLEKCVQNPLTKVIFFNVALCDWNGSIQHTLPDGHMRDTPSGKSSPRLHTRENPCEHVRMVASAKLLPIVRQLPNADGKVRKDITLVAFKTTLNATSEQMYHAGLSLLKESSANLVLVNDISRRHNLIVTPEEAVYHETGDREEALTQLVDMTRYRSQLTFTRSTVVAGSPVPWASPPVPSTLRAVVDYCVAKNAYKPFKDATVGHFACKVDDRTFLTSIRKSNFNDLDRVGLVKVVTDGVDTVIAYGAKPSVGGQSQRTIFKDHPGFECVAHFHCPLREGHPDAIPIVSQREVECGSSKCGQNTSQGMASFSLTNGNGKGTTVIKAVMLDNHGPNILFSQEADPAAIIEFIEANFDLSAKTGGYQLP